MICICPLQDFILIILQQNVCFFGWHHLSMFPGRIKSVSQSVTKPGPKQYLIMLGKPKNMRIFVNALSPSFHHHSPLVFDEQELVGKIERLSKHNCFSPVCCTTAQHCKESPQLKQNIYQGSLSFLQERKYFWYCLISETCYQNMTVRETDKSTRLF